MELWVRSQDKDALIKIDNIYTGEGDDTVNLQSDFGINKSCILGRYKTKKRALEVLDEIQKKLMPISEYKQEVDNLTISYKNIDTVIYEMPKDEEE